jgi:tetratricopeptide (TPR) repeat protein
MRDAVPDQLPVQASIHSVPFFAQKAYQCGPAAMAMVLEWSGLALSPDDLTPLVYTPERKGSLQANLIGAARRHGRLAYPISGVDCLIREIAAGHPVIVLQNLGLRWFPRWHYAVAIGYDRPAEQIILHTGLVAQRRVGFATFQRTFRRADQWGLVVLPPPVLPACAEEAPYLKAALGLQQAEHPEAASSAFELAVQHWPQSFPAYMGLGNIRYQSGDPGGALQAFHQATLVDPDNGTAFNNLAHVLAELDRLDEAEAAALRAVELGGRHSDLFHRTLHEIRQQRQ